MTQNDIFRSKHFQIKFRDSYTCVDGKGWNTFTKLNTHHSSPPNWIDMWFFKHWNVVESFCIIQMKWIMKKTKAESGNITETNLNWWIIQVSASKLPVKAWADSCKLEKSWNLHIKNIPKSIPVKRLNYLFFGN